MPLPGSTGGGFPTRGGGHVRGLGLLERGGGGVAVARGDCRLRVGGRGRVDVVVQPPPDLLACGMRAQVLQSRRWCRALRFRRDRHLCCRPGIGLLGMRAPWNSALWVRRVLLFKVAEEVGAGRSAELGPFAGTIFTFRLVGLPPATFGSPFREQSPEGKVFFRWHAVTDAIDQRAGRDWSVRVICVGDTQTIMKKRIHMKCMKPALLRN